MDSENHDRIATTLGTALVATVASSALVIPWFGFGPLAVVLAGIVTTVAVFKVIRDGRL